MISNVIELDIELIEFDFLLICNSINLITSNLIELDFLIKL